jgi:hypothetical protein
VGYTKRKIRGINSSFFLAALAFAGWALVSAWTGWPRSFPHSGAAGFCIFAVAALFFTAFPLIWARFPAKHPVNHELARYGKRAEVSERLDREMAAPVEKLGPFRFAATLLVYDSGHEFQMVPYDQIVSAEKIFDDVPAISVTTRKGRRYQWYRTWMQGTFDPQQVLEKIRAAAHLDDALANGAQRETSANVDGGPSADPSAASQSPSVPG